MKDIILLGVFSVFMQTISAQSVGIGTATPDASAALDVSSTTQGMLVPRVTTEQRTAITSPATGLLVFDMNTNSFWFKGGTSWVELIDSTNNLVHRNGDDIYLGMGGGSKFGIGTATPVQKLHVAGSGYVSGYLGLGTAAPVQRLHVQGNGFIAGALGIGTNPPNEWLEIGGTGRAFFGDGGGPDRKGLLIDGVETTGARIEAWDYGTGTGMDLLLNQFGGGKVGIGTATPAQRLHVQGDALVTGKLHIGIVYVAGPFTDVPPLSVVVASCDCPSGTQTTGGGVSMNSTALDLLDTNPASPTQWRAEVYNNSVIQTHQIRAWAICARVSD